MKVEDKMEKSKKLTVGDKVRKFSSRRGIDDTLEHSRYGIAGDGTRYGWDYLVYQADTRSKEGFLKWLKGVILILQVDLNEPTYPERVGESDKVMWKRYLRFLKNLKKGIERGLVRVEGKMSCRGCGKLFDSWDDNYNPRERLCKSCKKLKE